MTSLCMSPAKEVGRLLNRGTWAATTLAVLLTTVPAEAVQVGGSLRLFWIDNDFDSTSSRNTEQQFTLDLRQEISPFLSVRVRSRLLDLETRSEGAEVFSRRFRQPGVELLYARPNLSGRVAYEYRLADGTADPDNFEARSLNGSLAWRLSSELSLNLSFRDEANETDVSALGRDTDSLYTRAQLLYRRPFWSASYGYSESEIENRSAAIRADQTRHDVRLDAARDFFDRRLSLGLSASIGRSERRDELAAGADLAEPVPASRGLFTIDPTPELGELDSVSGLTDGDVTAVTTPVIEIGGANTFRNIGLDLGSTREASRLEIAVDRPSGAAVAWEVYRSRDNLFWERIAGSRSDYDGDRLRYTIFFPATRDRYFKAVNVSTNPEPEVRVTELRAFRELSAADGLRALDLDLYRVDGFASFVLTPRIRGNLTYGASNDDTRLADLVTQDREDQSASGGLQIDLTSSLRLDLGYRWADERDGIDPELDRTTDESSVSLTWTPLPTVDASVSVLETEESRGAELLQKIQSSRLALGLQLLPELRLLSEVTSSSLEDPFSGFDRDTLSWSQRLEARPLPSWRLGAGYSFLETETPERDQLFRRTSVFADTSWTVGSYLTVNGVWRLSDDATGDSLRQSYGLTYAPGPKISLTASWEELDSDAGRLTGSDSVGLTYRLYRRVHLSARLSHSRTAFGDQPAAETTSAQTGVRIRF